MTVRASEQTAGDDAVEAATGHPRAVWYEKLDAQGATSWSHRDIAAWLVAEEGVDGWWAQSVTVAYEQARGLRAPGQRSDGTYEANASKTIPGTVGTVFPLVSDAAARAAWLDAALGGAQPETIGVTAGKTVRLRWPARAAVTDLSEDAAGGRVLLSVDPAPDRADGTPSGKVRVSATHSGLAGPADVVAAKAFWRGRLTALAVLAAQPVHPER
ncbi:hypothetical protein GCM10025865_15030 [Paraoerskovia sediminicola]|uniref:DUF4287 domain-containing protein n=1 Tax=Paraoerskovia sediminicola TaxID=1138587 RepID=A0ABM8G2A8_9CELL|nr:hypothetical protein [Paraoerskovia sediminicola]BDZ42204.1 hypothetical protein GCM10025865_15030 [Paraoerskovia sediminicola]